MASKKHAITALLYDKKGNILSIGYNSYIKTHPLQAKYAEAVGEPKKIYLHAEIDAIVKCKTLEKAYKLVVLRHNNDGPASAKPCRICQQAISKTRIKVVEHT